MHITFKTYQQIDNLNIKNNQQEVNKPLEKGVKVLNCSVILEVITKVIVEQMVWLFKMTWP